MRTKQLILSLFLLLASSIVFADEEILAPDKPQNEDRVIRLKTVPWGWDNCNYAVCWYVEKDIMNIGSYKFCSPGNVIDVRMSPAGTTFAAMYQKGNNYAVSVYSYINAAVKHTFRLPNMPTAIGYTANARYLCIGDNAREVRVYNTSDYSLVRTIPITLIPRRITISPNNYFLAAADNEILYVWNFETGRVRKVMETEYRTKYIAFSADNAKMAVLNDNGQLLIYDTKTFTLINTFEGFNDGRECIFHPEGKYIIVLMGTKRIAIQNLKNANQEKEFVDSEAGIRHLSFARMVSGMIHLAYNSGPIMVFHPLEDLVPDYQQLVALEVEEKMDEWLKQMPGESLEDYHLRVNEESRALQYSHFENEAATSLAGDRVQEADVSFGSYNQEQKMLEINFDNMPTIFLDVPQEDVAEFSKPEDLVFENSVYAVTEDDKFELLYTEVTNKETGKKYVFDNLEKQSLDYLANNDNFVPLDLIQQSSMEEVKLQEIREEIVTEAIQASLISEHTHIDVKTKVEASTNADGDKIMNYTVEFNYDVEKEFSAAEDFGPGKYIIADSESALAMLRIVQHAFLTEFKQYIVAGKKVVMEVTGSADAAPINRKIPYGEEYGAFNEALVYNKGELTTLTVTSATGITTNEQLALLRAAGVKEYVQNNVRELATMQTDFDFHINVSNERGAEFRRIGIKFVFVDAFK